MGQVRALAGRLGALERIDVLASNAGLMSGQRRPGSTDEVSVGKPFEKDMCRVAALPWGMKLGPCGSPAGCGP